MLQAFFHAWERRLASVTKDRVVRPFDWGLEWIPENGHRPGARPAEAIGDWVVARDGRHRRVLHAAADNRLHAAAGSRRRPADVPERAHDAARDEQHGVLPVLSGTASSGRPTNGSAGRAAVLVLPQWNSDPGGHAGLCRLLAWNGLSALRLSLPYHDRRMPPELHRADYIVSANVARTVQVCRQAVLDARRAIAWLAMQGYDRIGILGTSLGSCLALLTAAHEPLIKAEALNHISPHFADVVWRGLSTEHVREGLDGHIELDLLRTLWAPISPRGYLERLRDRQTLLVYARYDLTFPVDLSEDLVRAFRDLGIPHEVAVLRCGHYSTGKAPFKFVDGWILTRFLKKSSGTYRYFRIPLSAA